jgi:serine protease inhibitor
VEVDEDGVTGAAYTLFALAEGAAEPPKEQVDFVLDRPFLFLVTSRDGSVLFSGVVNNI